MKKKKKKILINSAKNKTSKNVDIFLDVDLFSTKNEIKKEVLNNDFNLNKQFSKERNLCRNFRVYGEIQSNVVDCDNITIKVFSDPDYTNLIDTIQTTSVGYKSKNVFGKKRGKYILSLNNAGFNTVYFLIESNNLNFFDQKWSQQIVFFDLDNNFIPYGTETIDVDLDFNSININNNFDFFYNKHWINLDYFIKEEKKSIYSFEFPEKEVVESQQYDVKIKLNKPSPFGLEKFKINLDSTFSNFKYNSIINSQLIPINPGLDYILAGLSSVFADFNNKIALVVFDSIDNESFYTVGSSLNILDGDYIGEYSILFSQNITSGFSIEDFTPLPNIPEGFFAKYIILNLDVNINFSLTSNDIFLGESPDILFYLNDSLITLPQEISFSVGESEKKLTVFANPDSISELNEIYVINSYDQQFVENGEYLTHTINLIDSTPRKEFIYNLGEVYENRIPFTGRTITNNIGAVVDNLNAPSILRNGFFFENRHEEFYNNDFFYITIKNNGNKTILPINETLGIEEEIVFKAEEEKTFKFNTSYLDNQLHSVRLTYNENPIIEDLEKEIYINGFRIQPLNNAIGYDNLKARIDDGNGDLYIIQGVEKPFFANFIDSEKTIIFTSLSKGVKLNITSNSLNIQISELNIHQFVNQTDNLFKLYGNYTSNTIAKYSFTFSKKGFKDVQILNQSNEGVAQENNIFLVTKYSNILVPYNEEFESGISANISYDNDGNYTASNILNTQPTILPKKNISFNGILFLANKFLFNSVENLTNIGILNESNQEIDNGGFLSQKATIIPITSEDILSQNTKELWVVEIKTLSPLNPLNGQWAGLRTFEIKYGDINNFIKFKIGAYYNSDSTSSIWKVDAQAWWNNTSPSIPVSKDDNGSIIGYGTNNPLNEILDLGNSQLPEGLFNGSVINNKNLYLQSKQEAVNFLIENAENFNLTPENKKLVIYKLMDGLSQGNLNTAKNYLGGFAIEN